MSPAWKCVVIWLAVAGCVYAQEPGERDKERIGRLDQMARSLEKVKIDKVQTSGNQRSEDRRYSTRSELHMRFLICVSALINQSQDGVLLFPLQASGLTSSLQTSGTDRPKPSTGSDFQKVQVKLAGLSKDKPKATIDVPALRHGSSFDAVQLARDEIIDRIRWYFPEAEIEGKQKWNVKRLAIKNDTREPITVWLYYDQKARTDKGYDWVWKPSSPHSGRPLELTVAAGQTQTVIGPDEQPIETAHVRFWAESETGELWDENHYEALALVDENSELQGARAYYADRPATYEYHIRPHSGKRAFTERVVELHNATNEPIAVSLRYHTRVGGRLEWRSANYSIEPQGRVMPLDERRMRVRASSMHVSGQSDSRRYEKYADEPLWLVDEVDGRRIYQAETIGQLSFVFATTGEGPSGGRWRVKSASASIMDGARPLVTLQQNTWIEVRDRQPGWVLVQAQENGSSFTGWMREEDLEMSSAAVLPTPSETMPRNLTITAPYANVQIGPTVIATLRQGDTYRVLEMRDYWCRIEFLVDGEARQGWVESRYGQIR